MGLKVTRKTGRGAKLEEKLQQLKRISVLVGIPQEETLRENGPVNNAELLYAHTHGIRRKKMRQEMKAGMDQGMTYSQAYELYIQSHGSPIFAAPPRPVIEPAIEANKEQISTLMEKGIEVYLKRGSDVGLRKAGLYAAAKSKEWFEDPRNNWAPNSPTTIALKGSSKPLIDTGAMQNAITYVIRKDR